MSDDKGYILFESIVGIFIILTISSILTTLTYSIFVIKNKIENRLEIQQQSLEIDRSIKNIIGNSKEILINENYYSSLKSIKDIKCKHEDTEFGIEGKAISFNKNTNKIFIKNLRYDGAIEGAGYEIGCYVDDLKISVSDDGQIANIQLELSKGNENYKTNNTIYLKNSGG